MGLKKFDYRIKDNRKKNSIIVAAIIVLVLLVGLIIYVTFAEYKITKTYNLIQGRVAEFSNADLSISISLIDTDGTVTTATDFPSKDEYEYSSGNSSCENGSTIEFDSVNWTATISSSVKDNCVIAFKKTTELAEGTLGYALVNAAGGIDTITELDSNSFATATTADDAGMYKAEDDYGVSYYYRGNVTNNYVEFGSYAANTTLNGVTLTAETPMYWRIVRINGDGTIRLVYDGITLSENGVSHEGYVGVSQYNGNASNHKRYVGYMYGTDEDPYGENASTTLTDSTIKDTIDAWYEANLKTNYGSYIADSIFCNDREEIDVDDSSVDARYAYFNRYSYYTPKLTCTQKHDRFTVDDEVLGNGKLTNPSGLITADEAQMAGYASGSSTTSNYLDIKGAFWTSSPCDYDGSSARIFQVKSNSWMVSGVKTLQLSDSSGTYQSLARPVINLKADVAFTGSGTTTSPYIITTN